MKVRISSAGENLNKYLSVLEKYNYEIETEFEGKVIDVIIEINKENIYNLMEELGEELILGFDSITIYDSWVE